MVALITAGEYEDAGGDPNNPLMVMAIDAASEMVRSYLHQTVSLVVNDIVTLTGTGTRALLLPESPVVAVNSVTVDTDPVLVAVTDYRYAYGVLWRVSPGSTAPWTLGTSIVVNYDHGWSIIPADIQLVTARLAVAWAADGGAAAPGLRQESIQDYSYTRDDATNVLDAELAVLERRVFRQVPVT